MKNNGIALKDNGQSTRSRANLHNAQLCEDWLLIYCAKNEEQWYGIALKDNGQSTRSRANLHNAQLCEDWPLTLSDDTINLINYQLTLLISYKLLSSY